MNNQSSVGLTEELLTNLINLVALEYHLRITYEKYHSLLFIKKVSGDERSDLATKLYNTKNILIRTTEQRRNVMGLLQNLGTEDSNPDMWCSVKHSAVQMITMFEAWQVDLDNSQVESLYHSSVELFNMVVADFLGFVPQPCSACFADALRGQEELNGLKTATEVLEASDPEDVFNRAKEVFGNVPEFISSEGQEDESIPD